MNNELKKTLELIGKAKEGDAVALNEVCRRYLDKVHRLVRIRLGKKLRQKIESMDVVQDVMLKTVKDIDKFGIESESRFTDWLARIVENTIRDNADYYAAKKRSMSLEVNPKSEEADAGFINNIPDNLTPKVTDRMESAERMLRLEKALDQLDEKQREVIILRNYAGMTFKEIAALIGKSEDAARMSFVRSMDKLTDILSE